MHWLIGFLVGLTVGLAFFGGLWSTLRRLPTSGQPLVWLLLSFVIRSSIVIVALGVLLPGGWIQGVTFLAGFLVARIVVTWLVVGKQKPSEEAAKDPHQAGPLSSQATANQ